MGKPTTLQSTAEMLVSMSMYEHVSQAMTTFQCPFGVGRKGKKLTGVNFCFTGRILLYKYLFCMWQIHG